MKNLFISKNRFLTGMGLLLVVMSISYSCSKSSNDYSTGTNPPPGTTGGPGTNEVWIQNMAFTPSSITVAAGTTITWTNKDGVTHNVTSDSGVFSSGSMGTGATFSFKFVTKGTYTYKCTIHPSMTGSVTAN